MFVLPSADTRLAMGKFHALRLSPNVNYKAVPEFNINRKIPGKLVYNKNRIRKYNLEQ
jgi:hypothetical protein